MTTTTSDSDGPLTVASSRSTSSAASATSEGTTFVTLTMTPSTLESPTTAGTATSVTESNWLPVTLITQQATTGTPASVQTTPTATTTVLPNFIAPSGGTPSAPSNSTLVQIGFSYALNYPFIVEHSLAVAQIFQYLPEGISYGLNVSSDQTPMEAIEPYKTDDGSFIVSLALMYVPTDLVDTLLLGLHTPSSDFYNNPDGSVKALMDLIDPTIPLVASDSDNSGSGSAGSSVPGASSGSGGYGSSGDSDSSSSSSSAGSISAGSLDSNSNSRDISTSSKQTVGIAVGAVIGAIAYGVFVFVFARWFRKKKIAAARATASSMRQISPPMPLGSVPSGTVSSSDGSGGPVVARVASDGIGHHRSLTQSSNQHSGQSRLSGSRGSSSGGHISGRGISVPVMSENSLGWS